MDAKGGLTTLFDEEKRATARMDVTIRRIVDVDLPKHPPGDCLAVAPHQQAFNLHEFIPNLCPAGLVLAWPSPHFYLPPSPLILGWAVRTARSLKGVELSVLPTSGHLCDERPVSRPASYKVGIPPSPIAGRAEGSRFVLGSILLYRVNVERATAHLPRLRVFPTGLADSTHRANFINLQHTSSCVRDFAPSLSTTSPSVARDLERQCALVNPWGFQSVWLGSTRESPTLEPWRFPHILSCLEYYR